MNNELIILNENKQLEATKEGIKFIKKLQKAKLEVVLMEEQIKEIFLKEMEESGIDKYISPDGSFKCTYYAPTTQKRVDSKRLQKEKPEIYDEYLITSPRKAYVKFN